VPFRELSQILRLAEVREAPIRHYLFRHSEPPRVLIDFFRSQPPLHQQLEGLAWDTVLTTEVLDQAKSQLATRHGV
jgi:hypothetical protein